MYKKKSYILSTLICFSLCGCGRPQPPTSVADKPKPIITPQTALVRLRGEVFVKTRGAENIKLGLVEIKVMSMSRFGELVETMCSSIEKQEQELLDQDVLASAQIDLYENKVTDLHLISKQLETSEGRFRSEQDQHDQTLSSAFASAAESRRIRRGKIEERISELESRASSLHDRVREIGTKSQLVVPTMITEALQDIVRNVFITRTDSAGKFEVELSTKEPEVIIATDDRVVGADIEHYSWAVAVDPAAMGSDGTIMLSNHNMSDTDSGTNLLRQVYRKAFAMDKISERAASQLHALPDVPSIPEESPRRAPSGQLYLLRYVSIRNPHGVAGYSPGTCVKVIAEKGSTKQVACGDGSTVVESSALTDNMDLAETLLLEDTAQQFEAHEASDAATEVEDLRRRNEMVRNAEKVQAIEHANRENNAIGRWRNPLDER